MFEHAIAGAGVAGSSLALRLTAARLGRVLLVEPLGEDPAADARTIAFWALRDAPTAVDDLVVHEWSRLRVLGEGRALDLPLGAWRYAIVRAADLRARAAAAVRQAGGEVVQGHVTAIHERLEGASLAVETAEGAQRIEARWAYDSRPAEPADVPQRQTFLGWWVETPADAFDPDVATLMDFRSAAAPREASIRFFHVMPTTARRALVTGVVMGPPTSEIDVEAYLRDVLGLSAWTVEGVEQGSTALFPHRSLRRRGAHQLRVGNAGGRLKASTGYAFVRIQDDADAVVRSLHKAGHPFALPRERARWRILDGVFLALICQRGQAVAEIFVELFARNPLDRVLRFLDERVAVSGLLALLTSLPRWPWFAWATVGWLASPSPDDDQLGLQAHAAGADAPFRHQVSSVAFGVSFLLLAYLLWPFLVVLLAAVVLVVVTWGGFRSLAARSGRYLAATVLTVGVLLVVVTPLSLAFWLAARQVVEVANAGVAFISEGGLAALVQAQLARLPEGVAEWIEAPETAKALESALRDGLTGLVNRAGPALGGLVSAIAEGGMQAGIFVVVLWSLYVEGPTVASTLRRIAPLPDEQLLRLFVVFQQFAWNVAVGMLATSVGQGAVAALGFWLVGVDNIALLGFLTAVGSQVPFVGAAVVWAPVAVAFGVQGRLGAAVFLVVWSLALTASVDNVIKPFIYRHGLRVHPALVLLSLLGGLLTLGPSGLLVGPFVLVLFLALLRFHDPAADPEG